MKQQSNYSFETSLPAYKDNLENSKERQCDKLLALIMKGADCLLKLSEQSGTPQAVCSARMANLIEDKRAKYDDIVTYKERKRKKIVIVKEPVILIQGRQQDLFQ